MRSLFNSNNIKPGLDDQNRGCFLSESEAKSHLFLCGRIGHLPVAHYKPDRLLASDKCPYFVAFYENGGRLKVKGVYISDDSGLSMDHAGKSLL